MKKTILVLWLCSILPTYASTMCALNDTVSIVLDPSINRTSAGADATAMTWWAQFPYGRISGKSACLRSAHSSSDNAVANLTDTNEAGETKRVYGGELNGNYCWCKMTYPTTSMWVFRWIRGNTGEDVNCANECSNHCVNGTSSQKMRRALFGSISN